MTTLRPLEVALDQLQSAVTDACWSTPWTSDTAAMVWQLAYGHRQRWGMMAATDMAAELDAVRATAAAARCWTDRDRHDHVTVIAVDTFEAAMIEHLRRDRLPSDVIDAMTDVGATALTRLDAAHQITITATRTDGTALNAQHANWIAARTVIDAGRVVLERYLGIVPDTEPAPTE